jgi:hypothetical protein
MRNFFTRHPASVGESYFEHMCVALSFSASLFYAAFAALIHAFFPGWCEKTASLRITALHERMVTNRQKSSKDGQFQAQMPENARQ